MRLTALGRNNGYRGGGKISKPEKWYCGSEEIQIVSRFFNLGVELTPQLNLTDHVKRRTIASKNAINAT